MSYPVHYVPAGDVLPIFFSTFDGGTGASITMTGLAVTDIEIYKDGSVTQRASDAGYTLLDTDGIDFDGITGIHGFSIDTGDNTDAGFYTVGAWFHVVVSAVTVDTQTVSFIAAAFRIMPAEGVAGKPKVDVDTFGGSAGTFASGRPEVNTSHIAGSAVSTSSAQIGVNVVNAGGTAWGSGAITAASIANGAIDAATFAADVDAEILSYIVDDATRIDASALNTASATSIPAILADTGTDGVVVAAASKTGYTLSAAGLADFFDTDSGTTYASAVAGSVVKEIADNAGGSALTAAAIADAVWDEAQADHVAAGSFGEVATETAAILVDTAEIGAAGAGLTNINLPDQTMNITGNVTGNLSGSVGSVTGAVGSVAGNVDGNVTGTVAGVTPATAAQVAAVLTTQITEAYRANGAAPTLAEFMSEVLAHLGETAISGTTKTIKKLDHSTTAATFTLDDATTPASITRAT